MTSPISIIFFDVGGVLVRRPHHPLDVIARRVGVPRAEVERVHALGWARPEVSGAWQAMKTFEGQVEFSDMTARLMLNDMGVDATDERVKAISTAWTHQKYELVPGAHEVLEALSKQYRLGILSNAMPSRRYHELVDHNLIGYFDSVVLSRELGIDKPDPGIYTAALELAGVEAGAAAFVDDHMENVEAALGAGFRKAVLLASDGVGGSMPVIRASDLGELLSIF